MPITRSVIARRFLPLLLALGGGLLCGEVRASSDMVVIIGDVETLAAAAALRPLLRESLEHELKSANLGKSSFRKRYVLDASLDKLESSEEQVATSTCVVSAMLRTRKGSEVVAVIRGRATAEGSRGSAQRTRTEAVKAAARSAVNKISGALRDTEGRR